MTRFRLESGPVPLHHQVYLDLRAALDEGAWAMGEQLPPERELAARYGCSLITVRRALTELAREGRLDRARGRGTFVRRPAIVRNIAARAGFADEMRARGLEPFASVVTARVELAGEAVAAALGIDAGAPTHYLERVRGADGVPLLLEQAHLPVDRFPGLLEEDFTVVSLYDVLDRRYGTAVAGTRETISAIIPVDERGDPVEHGRTVVSPLHARYFIETTGPRARLVEPVGARPAVEPVQGEAGRRGAPVTTVRLSDWMTAPRLGIIVPPEGTPGWTDAAWWAVQLEAWGYPADRLPAADAADGRGTTTLVVAAAALDAADAEILERALGCGTSVLLAGRPTEAAAGLLGLTPSPERPGGRLRIDDEDMLVAAGACVPAPADDGCVVLDPPGPWGNLEPGWTVLASWVGGAAAVAVRPIDAAVRPTALAWFGVPVETLDQRATEVAVLLAEAVLDRAAPAGLVGLGRWPDGRPAALVVDGDVDHPTGVDPECARYVAPALETAARAGFGAYGIFAAGANVDAEPGSFPRGAAYYNHSHSHPYSHWNTRSWESLDADEMAGEIRRCAETFARHLGRGDEGIFRLPHFQLEAAERTYEVLDRLGYRAESSVGANVALTGGLPYHPARGSWSERSADIAWARSHPDPSGRFALLQLPISSDPIAPDFTNGFCSYNTLGEGVRERTAAPEAYEILLDEVVERAVARRALGHVFIDPPDAGYGRLYGDRIDYASAVERWLRRCVARDDLAILTTAGLAAWWSAREVAIGRVAMRIEAGELVVELADPPPGTTLAVLEPAGGGHRRRRRIRMERGPADR
ncbi:MAG: hypothetical protein H6Q36_1091, partial [Chloroflexi bacterium]|nr:hypothetical protein [Chloroflexota bacterium]